MRSWPKATSHASQSDGKGPCGCALRMPAASINPKNGEKGVLRGICFGRLPDFKAVVGVYLAEWGFKYLLAEWGILWYVPL